MRKLLLIGLPFFFLTIALNTLNGQVSLVKDINPGPGWSGLDFKFRIGDQFYFVANGDFGHELWISDGTPNGTELLKDINENPATGSDPDHFVEWNNTWYFSADDGVNGRELWLTDGTTSGTILLKDIFDGDQSSDPTGLVVLNGELYFSASDGDHGFELWKTDGTESGTVRVADINTGTSSSSPAHMVALGGAVIFAANNGSQGMELWKTDGTEGGTILLKDIYTDANSSFPTELTVVGDKVYFIADDGTTGQEIWRTDGTSIGTEFTNDIVSGAGHPQAENLTAVGDYLFFVGDNGVNGIELFRSDSNAPAAVEMVELFPDAFSSAPTDFIHLNGDLIFNAASSGFGYELWKANAIDGSVEMVKDIFPGFSSGFPIMLAVVNGELIFKANGENIGLELYKTDGTESGTVLIGDLNTDANSNMGNSDPQRPVLKDNVLYFTAWDANSEYQIWRTDGTSNSTQKLTSIPHDTIFNNTYKPYFINNIGNTAINFVALGDPYGEELWREDIDPVTVSDIQTNSPLDCHGDSDGTIDITVSGGVGDASCFTYEWSEPGLEGLNLTDLSAGSFTLTVTDCVGFTTIVTIDIEEPELVGGNAQQIEMVSCFGGNDGIASINGTGGTGLYTYQWSNGASGTTVINLTSGSHSITITDANGCIGETTVEITEPDPLVLDTDTGSTICFDGQNGQALVTPSGGTSGYTYLWDNDETTQIVTNLSGGNHSVTVTDANGCTEVAELNIAFYPELEIDFVSENVTCLSGGNGSIMTSPSGGTGSGYTYQWNTGATSSSLSNLDAGTYHVTVTDDNGCTGTGSSIVLSPTVSISLINDVSCLNGTNGGAAINIENPTSTYTYAWDNGETTDTASFLNAGVHSVTITDGEACTSVQSITINEPTAFVFEDSLSVGSSCFGASDGFISYNFSGGTMPYSYLWSTGATTPGTLTGLAGNETYCATITDAFECAVFEFCTTLDEPEALSVSLDNMTDASCPNSCDGSLSVSSGGEVFTFDWSTGETNAGTSSSIDGLCQGDYSLTISDGFCETTESFSIDSPDPIVPTFFVINTSCFGGADGAVFTDVSGGTSPYSFNYSNGASDLSAGEYTVTITDDNACSIVETFFINQPSQITVGFDLQSPTCIGDSNGSVVATASGGTGPYSYDFPNGQDDLAAGNYSVIITDANDCQIEQNFTILDPAPIIIQPEVNNISCFGEMDGNVTASASGGTSPYSFEYSGGDDQLEAGIYMVTATDANGCTSVDEFEIMEPDSLTAIVEIQNVSCFGESDGSVNIIPNGGTAPYEIIYNEGPNNLEAGLYSATIFDANNCIQEINFEIDEPTEIEIQVLELSSVSCFGGTDGSIEIEVMGGVPPYQFNGQFNDLSAGIYTISVLDATGCEKDLVFEIAQPDEIAFNISSTDATGADADGTASISVAGGVLPYQYEWNTDPVQTTEIATGLVAGDYQVTVTDSNGCTIVATVTVGMTNGLEELNENLRFVLYPNPANDIVFLEFGNRFSGMFELTVFDALGRKLIHRVPGFNSNDRIELNIANLNQGIYWVQLRNENGHYVKRLSVIKE